MSMLVLEDSVLAGLAMIPANVDQFPFLRPAMARSAMSCCPSKPPNLNPAKAAVAGLAPDRLAAFKKLLGVDKIRCLYRIGNRTTDVTV